MRSPLCGHSPPAFVCVNRTETQHFINAGDGWVCKRCRERESAPATPGGRARFFSEGEAEERAMMPSLSTTARARWRDETQSALVCPRCLIEETL